MLSRGLPLEIALRQKRKRHPGGGSAAAARRRHGAAGKNCNGTKQSAPAIRSAGGALGRQAKNLKKKARGPEHTDTCAPGAPLVVETRESCPAIDSGEPVANGAATPEQGHVQTADAAAIAAAAAAASAAAATVAEDEDEVAAAMTATVTIPNIGTDGVQGQQAHPPVQRPLGQPDCHASATPLGVAHAPSCDRAKRIYDEKLRDVVVFEHYSQWRGASFCICQRGNCTSDNCATAAGSLAVEAAAASVQAERADVGECCVVAMRELTDALENRVAKHTACALFAGQYVPLERHIVALAPSGWGRAHCTRAFCRRRRVNFIEIAPYLNRAELITDAVSFARALGTPTIVLFREAHKWLCATPPDRAASPFLGDFLNAAHALERTRAPVWFVYASVVAPEHFYGDFHQLTAGTVAVAQCRVPLRDSEIAKLVRHTLGAHLGHLGFDALSDVVDATDASLVAWARAQVHDMHSGNNNAAPLAPAVFSPRAIVIACRRLIGDKVRRTRARDLARIVALHHSLDSAASGGALLDRYGEEYTNLISAALVPRRRDFERPQTAMERMRADLLRGGGGGAHASAANAAPAAPPHEPRRAHAEGFFGTHDETDGDDDDDGVCGGGGDVDDVEYAGDDDEHVSSGPSFIDEHGSFHTEALYEDYDDGGDGGGAGYDENGGGQEYNNLD